MSKILAAVGGAGQEIALACLRLSWMSGLKPPQIYVFDSDAFGADGSAPGSGEREQTRSRRLSELGDGIKAYWAEKTQTPSALSRSSRLSPAEVS